MDLIKYLLEKPALTEHLVRWQSFLSQFEITYVTQKAIKEYTIAEHLAHLLLPVFDEINSKFSDEDLMTIQDPRDLVWSLYFDRAMNMKGRGIGVVLLSLEGVAISQACQLAFSTTNNVAEYEALLAGLKYAHILSIVRLKVMGDLQVILRQVLRKYRTRDPKLIPYQKLEDKMMKKFRRIVFGHVLRS